MARHSHPFLDPCFHVIYVLYKFCIILLRSFELTSAKCKHARILRSSQFTSFPCLSGHGGCHGMNLQLSELSLEVNSSMAARHGAFLRKWAELRALLRQRDVTCFSCSTHKYWGRWYYSTWHSEVLRDWNHGLRLKGSLWLVTESLCGNEQHRYLQI